MKSHASPTSAFTAPAALPIAAAAGAASTSHAAVVLMPSPILSPASRQLAEQVPAAPMPSLDLAAAAQHRSQLVEGLFACGWLLLGVAAICAAQTFSISARRRPAMRGKQIASPPESGLIAGGRS